MARAKLSACSVGRLLAGLGFAIDACLTASWWWRLRLWLAGRALTKALYRFGEDSMEVRRAHAIWTRIDFAVRFGRPASAAIRQVVVAANKSGARADDLALMLLNGDVVQVGGAVEVKRGSRAWFLLAVPTGLFLAYSLAICVASVAVSSTDWGELVLSLALLVPLHGLMWRVWLLLYIRVPMAPLRASSALAMVAKNHRPAALLVFSARSFSEERD